MAAVKTWWRSFLHDSGFVHASIPPSQKLGAQSFQLLLDRAVENLAVDVQDDAADDGRIDLVFQINLHVQAFRQAIAEIVRQRGVHRHGGNGQRAGAAALAVVKLVKRRRDVANGVVPAFLNKQQQEIKKEIGKTILKNFFHRRVFGGAAVFRRAEKIAKFRVLFQRCRKAVQLAANFVQHVALLRDGEERLGIAPAEDLFFHGNKNSFTKVAQAVAVAAPQSAAALQLPPASIRLAARGLQLAQGLADQILVIFGGEGAADDLAGNIDGKLRRRVFDFFQRFLPRQVDL